MSIIAIYSPCNKGIDKHAKTQNHKKGNKNNVVRIHWQIIVIYSTLHCIIAEHV